MVKTGESKPQIMEGSVGHGVVCPPYYEIDVHCLSLGKVVRTNAPEVIDGLGLNFNLGCALKYVVRNGRKPGATALDDIEKARDALNREIVSLRREKKPSESSGPVDHRPRWICPICLSTVQRSALFAPPCPNCRHGMERVLFSDE